MNLSGAFIWGALASSSLLVGALIVLRRPVKQTTLGRIMGFGAGVLISAVAYELVAEAFKIGERYWPVAAGLAAGAFAFYGSDRLLVHMGAEDPNHPHQGTSDSSLAMIVGIVLNGVPESITLGLALRGGERVSLTMVAAVFLSNLPEAMGATAGFEKTGRSRRWTLGLWLAIVFVSALSSFAGYALFGGAGSNMFAFVLSFAGGAVLMMLANTMMPEAFEHGGKAVGLFTVLGFAVAVAVVALEHR
jgi:ZIP family zinc transporter